MMHTTFSNKALNRKELLKLIKKIRYSDTLENFIIKISRSIKINRYKYADNQKFYRIRDFIKYLDDNDIQIIQEIEIKAFYPNGNIVTVVYEGLLSKWEISYYKHDLIVDKLIYNISPIMKSSILYKFREFKPYFILLYAAFYLTFLLKLNNFGINCLSIALLVVLIIDDLVYPGVAYREDSFFSRNRDSLIISFVSYVLGVITPYIIDMILK